MKLIKPASTPCRPGYVINRYSSSARLLSAALALLVAIGCAHRSRIEITSLNLAPSEKYEVDVLEIYNEKLLSDLQNISNGAWFRQKRNEYLALNTASKYFLAHHFIYQQGTPVKLKSNKRSKAILVFFRSNQLVIDESKPRQFAKNVQAVINLDQKESIDLVAPNR